MQTTDDLQLKHWVKITGVPDYRYAKFNKQVKMLNYTDEVPASSSGSTLARDRSIALLARCDRVALYTGVSGVPAEP